MDAKNEQNESLMLVFERWIMKWFQFALAAILALSITAMPAVASSDKIPDGLFVVIAIAIVVMAVIYHLFWKLFDGFYIP